MVDLRDAAWPSRVRQGGGWLGWRSSLLRNGVAPQVTQCRVGGATADQAGVGRCPICRSKRSIVVRGWNHAGGHNLLFTNGCFGHAERGLPV